MSQRHLRQERDGETDTSFAVVTIPIGRYDQSVERPFEDIDADGTAEQIGELLEPFGVAAAAVPGPDVHRDAAWVDGRLDEWVERQTPACSFLVWIGHGESDGERAWLATA